MAEKLVIIILNSHPQNNAEVLEPVYHATIAASMDYSAEIILAGRAGEHILLIDDIFDEGITIKAIIDELKAQNPQSLRSAVLLNKKHDRKVAGYAPDFVGSEVEDRYIYGCGMDYHGYLRHLPGIYALKQS